jgi:hypothetical protein
MEPYTDLSDLALHIAYQTFEAGDQTHLWNLRTRHLMHTVPTEPDPTFDPVELNMLKWYQSVRRLALWLGSLPRRDEGLYITTYYDWAHQTITCRVVRLDETDQTGPDPATLASFARVILKILSEPGQQINMTDRHERILSVKERWGL